MSDSANDEYKNIFYLEEDDINDMNDIFNRVHLQIPNDQKELLHNKDSQSKLFNFHLVNKTPSINKSNHSQLVKFFKNNKEDQFFNSPIEELQKIFIKSIDKVNPPSYSSIFSHPITKPEEREDTKSHLFQYLEKQVKFRRIADEISLILDELITNVLFNAPRMYEKIHQLPSSGQRGESVTLHKKDCSIFCFIADDYIYLGSIDSYGTLDLKSVLEKIYQSYEKNLSESITSIDSGDQEIQDKKGAGIGIRLILDRCTHFLATVSHLKKTIFMISIPVNGRKEIDQSLKTIHLYSDNFKKNE